MSHPVECPAAVESCDCEGRNQEHRELGLSRLRLLPDPMCAALVESMCHWTQNRGDAREQTHVQFHFGSPCPYSAMAAVLRGEPDPRLSASDIERASRIIGVYRRPSAIAELAAEITEDTPADRIIRTR